VIERDLLQDFLRQSFGPQTDLISHEPMFGGWNSAMSKAVVALGQEEVALVVRGGLPPSARVITSDLTAEWELLCALNELDASVSPEARIADLTGECLGEPTLLTEFIDGITLQLAVLTSPPDTHGAHLEEFARLAVDIHRVPLGSLPPSFDEGTDWEEYIEGRLSAWRDIEAHWIQRDPTMRYVAAWLDAHRPPPLPLSLVHGDFHSGNVMVTPTGAQIAFDWELAHVGDPREDLGWPMIYESVAPPALVTERQEQFCALYRARTGLGEDTVNPRTLAWFSLLNLSLVSQAMTPAAHAVVDGTSTSLTTAMGLTMGLTHSEHCLNVLSSLEAAR